MGSAETHAIASFSGSGSMSFNPRSALTPSHDDPLEDSVLIRLTGECPTGSRKSAATVNTSYPTFCISAMLSSSRSRCAFSIQRCS